MRGPWPAAYRHVAAAWRGAQARPDPDTEVIMRVLFVCWPQVGHLHPLLPLARAVDRAGHQVRFATGASVRERIERAGFGVEVGLRLLAEQVGGDPGAGLAPDGVLAWFMPRLGAAIMAPLMLPDLLAV